MKIGLVYYSRTGSTEQVAKILEEKFKEKKAEVDLIQIEHAKKPGFFAAGRSAMKQEELPIKNTSFDMKKYDFIITGSPTWGGNPPPFIKSFINKAQNVKGKKAAIFNTGMSPIDKRENIIEVIKNDLEKVGMKTTDNYLALKTKKGKIIDGQDNIDNFVNTILKK
jgi:flavodoxin